ncbi:Cerato-platanin-domain-containing protein [Scleroderma yunnanense]
MLLSISTKLVSTLFVAFLTLLAHPTRAQTPTSLSWDAVYGTGSNSLSKFACSDGSNGLEQKGYTTLDSLRNFPNVGGAPTVLDWNDPNCGKCYTVTYINTSGVSTSVNIVAVDVGRDGFVVSQQAMDTLTGNQASSLGRVDVTYVEADPSACQL